LRAVSKDAGAGAAARAAMVRDAQGVAALLTITAARVLLIGFMESVHEIE
jgi:hypothetical protein